MHKLRYVCVYVHIMFYVWMYINVQTYVCVRLCAISDYQ
jgi:hypothetical protein